MVAGGNWHVDTPSRESVNFTGTLPRFALKTLDPSALIGGWIVPEYADSKIAKGDNEVTEPQIILFTVSLDVVTLPHAPPWKWNSLSLDGFPTDIPA